MSNLSRADKLLLDEIRRGSSEGWTQLVDRYQGRLFAFARSKLRQPADAEDLVQETFVNFLKGLHTFREESSIETYLFVILRRKIADSFRERKVSVCLLQDAFSSDAEQESPDATQDILSPAQTASWYVRKDEDHHLHRQVLADAIGELIEGYKKSLDFRNLQVIEMIFYSQLPNKEIARIADVPRNHVAVVKHRCLKQISDAISDESNTKGTFELPDTLLTEIWQQQRLSCLKRNTIGAYLLGTLDEPWRSYADFHLNRLGCQYCLANLEDLRQQSTPEESASLRRRVLDSTVGFLSKP